LRQRITSFVEDYNTAMKLVNDQFKYDAKTKKSGPLSGDVTLMTLQSQLRSVMTAQIPGLPENFNAAVLVGLSFDRNGQLNIDADRLDASLTDHLDDVKRLFIAEGEATDSGIEYLSSGNETRPGTYAVEVTRAAARARFVSGTEFTGELSSDFSLRLVDRATQQAVVVDLAAGSTLDDVVKRINAAASSDVAEVRRGTIANAKVQGGPITAATPFADILGAHVQEGDSIRINGTTHSGDRVSTTFRIDHPESDTVGDLLAEVRRMLGGSDIPKYQPSSVNRSDQ